MANYFDQFDAPQKQGNYFDRFDDPNYKDERSLGATVVDRFKQGVETVGAGLSAGLGRKPEVIASDLKDTVPTQRTTEELDFQARVKSSIEAFDKDRSVGNFLGILGNLATNPKQALGEVANSIGMSLPAYGGAAGGAATGALVAGPVGAVAGGIAGFLLGNLSTNVTAEIAGKLQEDLTARGVDLANPAAVTSALQKEPELISQAREWGARKGAATTAVETAVDVATVGAGRILKPATSMAGRLGKAGGVMASQGVGEGLGSAAGSVAVGEEVSPGQAIYEGALGALAGLPEGAAALKAGQSMQRGPDPLAKPPGTQTPGEVVQTMDTARTVDEAIAIAADLLDEGRLVTDEKLRATQQFMKAEADRATAATWATDFDRAVAEMRAQESEAAALGEPVDTTLAAPPADVPTLAEPLQGAQTPGSTSDTSEAPIGQPAPASQASDPATQRMLERMEARLDLNPSRITTSELAFIAQHHPDPARKEQATQIANARRNARVFTDVVQNQPLALPAPPDSEIGRVRGKDTVFVGPTGAAGKDLGQVGRSDLNQRLEPQMTDEARAAFEQKKADLAAGGLDPLAAESPLDMSQRRVGMKPADSVVSDEAGGEVVDQNVVAELNKGLQADDSGVEVRAVHRGQLPADRVTHEDGSTTISQAEAADIENLAKVYGKSAVFVEDLNGNGPEGAVVQSDDKRIFVAVRSKSAHQLVVAAHEIAHHMERDAPDLHKKLVTGLIGGEQLTEESPLVEFYRYYHNKAGMPAAKVLQRLSDEKVRDQTVREFVADIFGNRHAELKTHQMLFNAAKASGDENLIYKIANFIIGYIDRLLQRVKLKKFGTDNLVKDLQRTRKLVREVAREYAVRQGKKSLEADRVMMEDAVERKKYFDSRKNWMAAFEGEAPTVQRSAARSDSERTGQGELDLHVMDVKRAERFADSVGVGLSSVEQSRINEAAAQYGLDAKEMRATILAYKAAHPTSKGWAEPIFAGIAEVDGKFKHRYVTQPYTFSDDANGKALDPVSPAYTKAVEKAARGVTGEVRKVFTRAQKGDKNAETMIRQAGWYANMRVRLRQEFGGLADLFVDSLGATSPNTPVRDNWAASLEVLRRASRGDYDQQIEALEGWVLQNEQFNDEFRAWFDERLNEGMSKKEIKDSAEYKEIIRTAREIRKLPEELSPGKESGKKFGVNSRHVARVLVNMWRTIKAEDPDLAIGGTAPKAINFSGNLIGYREGATIDVWAARMLQRLSGGTRAPAAAEDGVSGNMLPSGKTTLQFGFGQDVFARAAETIRSDAEMSTDKTLANMRPDDLQAVVWFVEKEIWAKNGWTTPAGEGGSFEFESDLSGSSDQSRIRELRKIIDAKGTKAADRRMAMEELKTFNRTVDRFVGGLSTQQSVENQGVDYVPDDPAMAELSRAVKDAIYRSDDGLTVLGSKALSTVGRYGGEERSLDIEVIARENYDPTSLMLEMLKQAQAAKQDSMFLSRVVPMDEEVDPLRHRPGLEIYFREQGSVDKVEPLLKTLEKTGVGMYTIIVDGRRNPLALSGEMPSVVGVRMQYIPEFDVRYGGEFPNSDAEIQRKMKAEGQRLRKLADNLMKKIPDISYAGRIWYETDVRFQDEYQGAIDALSNRTAEAGDRGRGEGTWQGRSIREGVAAATGQRGAADGQPGGTGDATAGGPVQRSAARGSVEGGNASAAQRGDQRSRTPPVDQEGRVRLDHWSSREGLSALDPAYHGKGLSGAESRRKRDDPDNWVDRTYFGVRGGGYQKEAGLGAYHYEVDLSLATLYDFKADPLKLYSSKVDGWDNAMSVYERKIRDAGFAGYWVDDPSLGMVAAVYRATVPNSMRPQISQSQIRAATANPVFKRWFGDSKVINEDDGSPSVWYHGTARDITEFQPKQANAIFVTRDPDFADGFANTSADWITMNEPPPDLTEAEKAEMWTRAKDAATEDGFGPRSKRHVQAAEEYFWEYEADYKRARSIAAPNIIPMFVRAENPFIFNKPEHLVDVLDGVLKGKKTVTLTLAGKKAAAVTFNRSELWDALVVGSWNVIESPEIQEVIRALGHDAFTVVEGGNFNLAVYNSNQLKSVFNENPTESPRIDRSMVRAKYLGNLDAAQEAALEKAGAIVDPSMTLKQKMNAWKANLGMRMAQGMVDQFRAIKDVDQRAYMMARMSKGTDGLLEAMFLYGKPYLRAGIGDVRVNPQGGFAKVLANLDGEHGRFIWWVAALRAARLKAEGRENLLTDADIAALQTLNANDAEHPERAKKFRDALDSLNDYNKSVLNIARESGLIDDEGYDLMKDQPYVPFYRVMKDGVEGPGFGSGLTRQYFSKKLKGGKEALNQDLLENMLLNWSHVFEAAAKNRAAKAAIDAAVDLGVAYPVPSGTKGSTTVREGGFEKHYMIEDPYLFEAIGAVNYASPSWYKPFSTVKHWLTVGVTANPSFKIRNLIRDSVQAIGTSQLGFNPFGNVKRGFMNTDRQSQTYASMLAGGGMMRFGTVENSDHATSLIKKQLKGQGSNVLDEKGFKKLTGQIADLWHVYNDFGDRLENVNRAALYEKLIAQGKDHAEASFMSRDLMDFSMSGRWPVIRFLAQAVPFMNARMQGLYKLGRAASEDPRKLGVVTTAVIAASMALLFAYEDDDDWKKREDWDRDNFWWFKIGETAFRIPKPFELGAVGTVVERTWELGFDKEMTGKRYAKQIAGLFFEQFSMSPVPQLIKPFVDIYSNKDSFTGRAIETMGLERLRPEDRITASTSNAARFLGQLGLPDMSQLAMGRYSPLSPVQIDYLIRGYAGWVGATATTVMDYGIRPLLDRGEKPEMRLKDVFLVGGFAETLPTGSSRYVTQMYEESRDLSQVYASWRAAIKMGDTTKAAEIATAEREKLARYNRVNRVSDAVSDVGAMIKRIEEDKNLSAERKRVMIDDMRQRQDRLARAAVAK